VLLLLLLLLCVSVGDALVHGRCRTHSQATLEALSHFQVTADFDIKGSDCCGSPFMETSVNQCAEKCFGDVHCMGWSHQDDVSACWLKCVPVWQRTQCCPTDDCARLLVVPSDGAWPP
jgi:hypothetical protein